jgi:hypothetical protein
MPTSSDQPATLPTDKRRREPDVEEALPGSGAAAPRRGQQTYAILGMARKPTNADYAISAGQLFGTGPDNGPVINRRILKLALASSVISLPHIAFQRPPVEPNGCRQFWHCWSPWVCPAID